MRITKDPVIKGPDEKCRKCGKGGQAYYPHNLRNCRECERERSRLKSRKFITEHRLLANKRALENYYRHRDAYRRKHKEWQQRQRDRVFEAYGGYKCACCGETERMFLTIDHINGGGTRHRKELKGGGMWVYRWIENNDFPEGFQVLCMNCNFAKGQNFRRNGVNTCPHANRQ